MVATGNGAEAVRIIETATAAHAAVLTGSNHSTATLTPPLPAASAEHLADYDGRTCLHIAAAIGDAELFDKLVEAAANADFCDHRDRHGVKAERPLQLDSGATFSLTSTATDLDGHTSYAVHRIDGSGGDRNRSMLKGMFPPTAAAAWDDGPDGAINNGDRDAGAGGGNGGRDDDADNSANGSSVSRVAGSTPSSPSEDTRVRSLLLSVVLCDKAKSGDVDGTQSLLDLIPDPLAEICDYDFRGPLHVAACEGNDAVIDLLIRKGAPINARDRWGKTPLWGAVFGKHASAASLLKKNGATLGMSTMHLAASACDAVSANDTDLLKLLLLSTPTAGTAQAGGIIGGGGGATSTAATSADYDGRTALHVAAELGYNQVYNLLKAFGADETAADRWGKNPAAIIGSSEDGGSGDGGGGRGFHEPKHKQTAV